ncbi:LysR family transcriptional regulator [Methylobacterium durans]|uniref:LysR family transcriptional regulator n=1 Tax=Methylobacterium durans TaxID=2202825 RepID=UPI002AFDF79A|nr:LysR family transcriptional regulator [Methylobacterium durans]MEA1830713.1 LysR family transcriptional regulator [Methylobacterium durans]
MDRLDELAIFVAIVEQGSLAAAARRLRRSAPAVTRALAGLEERAGIRLLERTTRRLAPTEAGRALAEQARAVLAAYETAMGGLSDAPVRGLLRVTAPIQFGRLHMAPVVASFLDAHPETQVELVLADRNLDLIEDGLDLALRIDHLADSSLLVRRVGTVRRVLVASPAYLAARGVPQSPAELAAHDTIFGSPRTDVREWRFGSDRRGTVVRLAPRLLVNEIEAQLIAVRAGRGIARVLSYQVAEEVAAGRLVRLLRSHEPPPIPVQLVARGGPHRPPKVAAFLAHAAERLRRLPVIREEE